MAYPPIFQDPFVEAVARALCQEAGKDPDAVVDIEGVEVVVDGVRHPATMRGAQWITYAIEAARRMDEEFKRQVAQVVRTPGRA